MEEREKVQLTMHELVTNNLVFTLKGNQHVRRARMKTAILDAKYYFF